MSTEIFILMALCGGFALFICAMEIIGFLCTFVLYKLGGGKRNIKRYWKHWNEA